MQAQSRGVADLIPRDKPTALVLGSREIDEKEPACRRARSVRWASWERRHDAEKSRGIGEERKTRRPSSKTREDHEVDHPARVHPAAVESSAMKQVLVAAAVVGVVGLVGWFVVGFALSGSRTRPCETSSALPWLRC